MGRVRFPGARLPSDFGDLDVSAPRSFIAKLICVVSYGLIAPFSNVVDNGTDLLFRFRGWACVAISQSLRLFVELR